jgi:putative phosphoribosyl transferase
VASGEYRVISGQAEIFSSNHLQKSYLKSGSASGIILPRKGFPFASFFGLNFLVRKQLRFNLEETMITYKNREEAGNKLAEQLLPLQLSTPVLLAIPRGGVPVAASLGALRGWKPQILPLWPLRAPQSPENPFGFIDLENELYLNRALAGQLRVSPSQIRQWAHGAEILLKAEMDRWGAAEPTNLQDQTVLLVDEGIHSGWTLYSAIQQVHRKGARRIIVGAPVSTSRALQFLTPHCHQLICPVIDSQPLFSISSHYQEWPEVTDAQIRTWLH